MKKEKSLNVVQIDNTEKEKKLNAFNKLMKRETNEAYQLMEKAKKNYEDVLKRFIINEITGEQNFERIRKVSISMTIDSNCCTPWFDMCDDTELEVIFLIEMINLHLFDLINPEEMI